MSAEAWRRNGSDMVLLHFSWQECDTFSTAGSICVAGVALSVAA